MLRRRSVFDWKGRKRRGRKAQESGNREKAFGDGFSDSDGRTLTFRVFVVCQISMA